LRNYPYLRRELNEIRQDIIESAATQDDLGVRVQGGSQTSATERKAIQLESDFRLRRLHETCKAIERALEQMPSEKRRLVERRYWRADSTNMTVAHELNISERTYRYWRNWCVEFVAYHLGFVAECVPFDQVRAG
jgi:RinA family phage transcriptional activator